MFFRLSHRANKSVQPKSRSAARNARQRRPALEELESRLVPSMSQVRPPSMTPTGAPPVAVDDFVNTVNGLAVAVNILSNDYDPDGTLSPSSVAIVAFPAHGLVSVDSISGQAVYFPMAGYIGGDSFSYTVRDNAGLVSNTARVDTANGPGGGVGPITFNDSAFTDNGQPVTIAVLDNDLNDPGSLIDPASVTVTAAPNHGSVSIDPVTGAITYAPAYPYVGADSFIYTFMNTAGETSDEGTVAIVINPLAPFEHADPLRPGAVLSIDGTGLDDDIRVSLDGSTGLIDVRINGAHHGPFDASSRVVVYGYGGDDKVQVSQSVWLPVWVFGGTGNDTIQGGGTASLLVGGDGDDVLSGGKGPTILIGGAGGDQLTGGGDGDILLAGATDFDRNEQALFALLSEWTSGRGYADRVNNLTGVDNPAFAARKNGDYFLTAATVHDDNRLDFLTGGGGQDFAFVHLAGGGADDWITDFIGSEHKGEVLIAI